MKSIMVYSGKGGVGKTTTTINLANSLVEQGKSVYILDADINTPSCHVLLGHDQDVSDNLRFASLGLVTKGFMVITGSMVKQFIRESIKDAKAFKPDFLLIDTPPSITDTHLSLMKTLNLSGVVVVTQPTALSLEDTRRTLGFFELGDTPVLGLVENMSGDMFNDDVDYDGLSISVLASIPFDKKLQNTVSGKSDLSMYSGVVEKILSADDVIQQEEKKLTQSNISQEHIQSKIDGGMGKDHAKILKFHNTDTWDFVIDELMKLGILGMDQFLRDVTTEKIERVLAAFNEGDEESFFMVTNAANAPGNLFPGEIGVGVLVLDADSHYGVPRIKYQVGSDVVTLFPNEIMPVSYKDVAAFTSEEGYIPLSDRRLLPSKEALEDLFQSFGNRVGNPIDWEERYDSLLSTLSPEPAPSRSGMKP